MKVIVTDTNVFLRFLLQDVPSQNEKIEKIFKKAKQGSVQLVVPQSVIFELSFALQKYYGFPKEKVIECLKSIIEGSYWKGQDKDIFTLALKLYSIHNISLPDSFIAAWSQLKDEELFSFDEKLNKILKSQKDGGTFS